MDSVTVKQLHLKTKAVLDQVERGEAVTVTRSGRAIVRIEAIREKADAESWADIMSEVWEAQKEVRPNERVKNPVLEERKRRRR